MGTTRFVTYFDSSYAAQGVTMLRSLLRHCPQATVTVLELDDGVGPIVESELEKAVEIVPLGRLLTFEPRLATIQSVRTQWEFYSTLRPTLMLMMMESVPSGDVICYVDADIFFYSDPLPMFSDICNASVALSPHRFSPETQHLHIFRKLGSDSN